MVYFRKYLGPIVKTIEDPERFGKIIDKTDSDSATKMEFRTLGNKLKGKMEDEAITTIILTAKNMIPQGITFLTKLILDNLPH